MRVRLLALVTLAITASVACGPSGTALEADGTDDARRECDAYLAAVATCSSRTAASDSSALHAAARESRIREAATDPATSQSTKAKCVAARIALLKACQ